MARAFELTTRIKGVQRSQGDSATAKAAYRACCAIECEREGKTHDYSRKKGLDLAEIELPGDAPAWAKERAKLWNRIEGRERNGKRGPKANAYKANAQVARDYLFTFAGELSAGGRRKVARAIARHLVEAHGVAVDFAIHAPGRDDDGDERNWHCHMMFSTRRLTAKGFGEKTREWDERGKDGSDEPSLAKQLRAFVAKVQNEELAAEGKADLVHVEHQTYKERGKPQAPTRHMGPEKTHLMRKERRQAREAWFRQARKDQHERHSKELAGLKLRQDFALQKKLGELSERERKEGAAIRRELEKKRQADRQPEGARRAFLAITGRAGREAFDRQARDAQRIEETSQKLDGLKAAFRIERHEFATGQARERAALIERHGGEDRQLHEAAQHRHSEDRAREIQQRQDTRSISRQNDLEQERGGRSIGPELS